MSATVQSVLRANRSYKDKLSGRQKRVFDHLYNCRTVRCGFNFSQCENCGKTVMHYNSCRDRHCPQCQAVSQEVWAFRERQHALNIQYFHVVFTLPNELNRLALAYPKEMYNLLFNTVAETLNELSADEKYLGAQIGFTSVLHTWGQNLSLHPHLHVIVSGGGHRGKVTWIDSKKDFFIPVKVLSKKFRGRFLDTLKKADFFDCDDKRNKETLDTCYQKGWVVYCKKPFRNPEAVIKYLSRYTHRISISNGRILKHEDHKVTFKYKDYKDGSKIKEMTLDEEEFMRRFFMHVLPKGFTKIRHYGFLSGSNKKARLAILKKLTNTPVLPGDNLSFKEIIRFIMKKFDFECPHCHCPMHKRE